MHKDISHPVTNGKTKLMIFTSLCFLFILALISISFIFVSVHTADLGITGWWALKSILGVIAIHSVAGIIYAVKSFFDTREATQKQEDKLARLKERNHYKLERMRLRSSLNKK